MTNKLKVAIIGLWGHEIYPLELAQHPNTKLIAVCDWTKNSAMTENLREMAVKFEVDFCDGIASLIQKGPFDAVAVNVPSRLIPDVVEVIAPHTRSLLLEKPVAADIAGARKLYQAALTHNLLVSIAYPTRYKPELRQCKEAILRGDIGHPIAGSYTNLVTWGPRYCVDTSPENLSLIAGGDDTMHMGYCVLDMEYLAGSRITNVFARGGAFFYENYQNAKINDLCHVTFKMENGFAGSFTVGRISVKYRPPIQTLEVSGDAGCLVLDYSKPHLNVYGPDGMEQVLASASGLVCAKTLVNDFVSAVASNGLTEYNSSDAFHTIAVQEAVKKSLVSGQTENVESE